MVVIMSTELILSMFWQTTQTTINNEKSAVPNQLCGWTRVTVCVNVCMNEWKLTCIVKAPYSYPKIREVLYKYSSFDIYLTATRNSELECFLYVTLIILRSWINQATLNVKRYLLGFFLVSLAWHTLRNDQI